MDITKLLKYAVDKDASDLHLSAGYPPMVRLDGELKKIDLPALKKTDVSGMIDDILSPKQKEKFKEHHEIDFAYEIDNIGRFRSNVYTTMNGVAAAFRVIPNKIRTLDDIGAPEGAYTLARLEKGLVLVTGPTGSGKSTTLAAIIYLINTEKKKHIITIEDPIEYVHTGINCLINQREIGAHSKTFSAALRSALREDPDVILVGELRDLETISLAVTAAETGHLVFATLHTSNAPETVDRVIDVFPVDQQNQIRAMFSSTIQGVIAQKLVVTKGKKGRSAAMEVMIASNAIRNLIRERKVHQMSTVLQTSMDVGMQTMDQALMTMLNENKIDKKTAVTHALEKRPFEEWKGTSRDILQRD
ncbi:type IV pilus twitching motility protein PilT [candidate division KSB1 bacterium]|nr:type IV pilus twitching motility protein PilT [candidate division KSB1 bacterium]